MEDVMSQLKLIALDAEDLQVISTCCQDAVLKIGEMKYLATERKFVMTLNRYAWENGGAKERHRSVLHFAGVNSVKASGIDRGQSDVVISLHTILSQEGDAPGGLIELVFAGDGAIRLDVECVEAQLSDMPAAWEAQSTPSHE